MLFLYKNMSKIDYDKCANAQILGVLVRKLRKCKIS